MPLTLCKAQKISRLNTMRSCKVGSIVPWLASSLLVGKSVSLQNSSPDQLSCVHLRGWVNHSELKYFGTAGEATKGASVVYGVDFGVLGQ